MNTRKLLVSLLMFVCVLLSACTPVAAPTVIPPTATITPTRNLSTPTPELPTETPLPPTATPVTLPPGMVPAGQEDTTIKVGSFPQQAVVGEGAVWVPNAGSGSVSRIDPQTNEIVATIPIGEANPNNGVYVPSRVTIGDGYVWAAKKH